MVEALVACLVLSTRYYVHIVRSVHTVPIVHTVRSVHTVPYDLYILYWYMSHTVPTVRSVHTAHTVPYIVFYQEK